MAIGHDARTPKVFTQIKADCDQVHLAGPVFGVGEQLNDSRDPLAMQKLPSLTEAEAS